MSVPDLRLRRLSLVVSACLVLAVAGPAAAQDGAAGPSPSAVPVEISPSGSWEVLAFDAWGDGLVAPRPDTRLTLSLLAGGRLEGLTGCGGYFGGYSVDGEFIGLGIISKGFDECGPRKTEEAVAFSVALEAVSGWRPSADGAGLELVDDRGQVRLSARRDPDGDFTGDWLVTEYARANGELTTPLADRPMRLTLAPDGGASGSTGCRFFDGEYRRDGERVVIGPIEPIGPACDGPERRPARRFLAAMGEVAYWQRESDTLTLSDAFREPLIVARAVVPTPAPASPEPSAGATIGPSSEPLEREE
jgi:heat shock protein HslJ